MSHINTPEIRKSYTTPLESEGPESVVMSKSKWHERKMWRISFPLFLRRFIDTTWLLYLICLVYRFITKQ